MGLDVNHREILLTDCAAGGEQFKIMLSAYSGDNNFSLHMDSEIKILEPELTPLEHAAYKRGRNAKSVTMAKHATMIDYRMATGFEALMGYLYLKDEFERLVELVKNGVDELALKM